MALNNPTPADITDQYLAWWKDNSPLYHGRRFEVQVHRGDDRQNFYFPIWDLVEIFLGTTLFKPDDPKRPDRVIVSDGRDTCIRVLEWEKCWYGYRTLMRRGAAIGKIPRGWDS